MLSRRLVLVGLLLLVAPISVAQKADFDRAVTKAKTALIARHGKSEAARIERGLRQVRMMWRKADGDASAFYAFVTSEFLPNGQELDQTFKRLEFALERTDGYLRSLSRDLRRGQDLEIGPFLAIDYRLAGFEPAVHVKEDLFRTKVAFVVLLNFRLTTLPQRLAEGGKWSRRQWAEARLALRFATRGSPEREAFVAQAYARAQSYVSSYNIYTHHLLTKDGRRLFPAGQRLLSHWNLRDEIKANYGKPEGLGKQRLLGRVMEAVVQQTIPAIVIDNPRFDWTPETGQVALSKVKDVQPPKGSAQIAKPDRENDERYRRWLEVFRAEKSADSLDPLYPTYVERRFSRDSEIPESEVARLLDSVLSSPLATKVARTIRKRLGRKLEAFDVFYSGFMPDSASQGIDLDSLVKSRYPTVKKFTDDIPRLLGELGFDEEKAGFLAQRIVVEPARGSGHAFAPMRRDDKAHLRTRFEPGGMDYKGYNIAIHEMGHNVEQIFSTTTIDYMSLRGVPNLSFTEALAFVFQSRDLKLLGVAAKGSGSHALHEFWETRQVAGAAMVDMAAWRWLYRHPNCTPAEFRKAVVGIAQDVWNRYFSPHFGVRDSTLLGIYSHMVDSGLYLPDYPLARLIAFQIEQRFDPNLPIGPEFERLARLGYLTPDAWLRQGVGARLSAKPLLDAVEKELAKL